MSDAAAPSDPKVAAVFASLAPGQQDALLALRRLILEVAAEADIELVETLKWGEPAYLPAKARVGTTVRINAVQGSADGYALYVNCNTSLLDSYRHLYPHDFAFDGQRGLVFRTGQAPPEAALKHCVALALTYHRANQAKSSKASSPGSRPGGNRCSPAIAPARPGTGSPRP